MYDEHSGVMFPKTKKTYNYKGYASCHARVPNNLETRQMSCLPIFSLGGCQLPNVAVILPLAPKVIKRDVKGRPLAWDVSTPASSKIAKEMKLWPKNITVYFWKSCLCREPVFRQLVVDFGRWTRKQGISNGEKLFQMDWYDSHCDKEALGTLKAESDTIVLFTENACTDILAVPDGGLIKTLTSEFRRILDLHVADNFDLWYSTTTVAASKRRVIMLDSYSRAWVWFCINHNELPFKVAIRTGCLFPLKEKREDQFNGCVFRGYDGPDKKPMNPFRNESFKHAVARLSKNKNKRKAKGGALTFEKRKKRTNVVSNVVK